MNDENSYAESLVLLLTILFLIPSHIFLVAPVALWLIFNPLGITVAYMGRVSIGLGLFLIQSSLSSGSK